VWRVLLSKAPHSQHLTALVSASHRTFVSISPRAYFFQYLSQQLTNVFNGGACFLGANHVRETWVCVVPVTSLAADAHVGARKAGGRGA
jgi:glutamine amidotransferase-like uncharacterized protein